MELYSNEPRMMNRDTAQLMIEEMKNELESQKKLLDKKDREIEELQHLLKNGYSRPIQGTKERPDNQSDSLDMVYNIVSNLEKYTNEEVTVTSRSNSCSMFVSISIGSLLKNRFRSISLTICSPSRQRLHN